MNNEEILSHYDLSSPIETISEPKGDTASSSVIIVTLQNKDQWVIKGSNWYQFLDNEKAAQALETAYTVSELLRIEGVPVPEVLKTKSRSLTYFKNDTFYSVQRYIDGRPFLHSEADIGQFGRALGIFHRAGRVILQNDLNLAKKIASLIPTEKPYEESRAIYPSKLKEALLDDHNCTTTTVCELVKNSLEWLENQMQLVDAANLLSTNLTTGLLHNDLNTRNVLFNSNGEINAILDVDQLGVGPCIFDVGNTVNSFAWKLVEDNDPNLAEKIALFIAGYHQEHPLPKKEYELLSIVGIRWDLMRILRTLRRHHFENNRLPKLLESVEKRFIPRVKRTHEVLAFITPEWIDKVCK